MLSKEEQKQWNTSFWTRFKAQAGKYKSANGQRIKWVNYPTGVKQIFIRMKANKKLVRFSIEIQDKDASIRELFWTQFLELKRVLEEEIGSPGNWEEETHNDVGWPISRISWSMTDLNMFQKDDQKKMIQFLIKHIRSFDKFYCEYGEIVIALGK